MYQNLFFIDLDGTLIQEIEPEHYYVPSNVFETIWQLKKVHCLPVVCTARQPAFVEKLFGNLFSTGIYFNGSYIICEGNVISKRAYTQFQLGQLLRYAETAHCGLILQGITHAWSYAINPEYFSLLNKIYYINDYMRSISLKENQAVYSVDTFFLNMEQYKLAQQKIEFPYYLDYHDGDWTGIIINKTINKGTAALELCHYMNISPSKCYAIGDSKNDIPLLQCVGHGIAVQNACPELHAIAEYITSSCIENGVIRVAETIISLCKNK